MRLMTGLTVSSLKRHPALMPLFVIVGAGLCGSGIYLARLAITNPDVVWDKSKPEQQAKIHHQYQYKLYSPVRDYSKLENERPNIDDEN